MQFRVSQPCRSNAIYTTEPLQVFFYAVGLPSQVFIVAGAGDHHYGAWERVGSAQFLDNRFFSLLGKMIEISVLHFPSQVNQALSERGVINLFEPDQDIGDVVPAGAEHILHIPDSAAQRVFDGVGNAFFYICRRGAGINADDVYPVEVNLRVLGPGHLQIGERPQDDHQTERQVRQYVIG